MQVVKLIHNPTAGDEEHSKEALVEQIEKAGFECRYASTKKDNWKEIEDDVELVVAAGGDGTVRKVIRQVLKQKGDRTLPVAVLALGTANNIAKTFDINKDSKQVIQSWKNGQIKNVDVGVVENVPGVDFFLEGFGFGLFPHLMKEMKECEGQFATPEEELKFALKKMHELVLSFEPRHCQLEIDGTDHSGNFLLVEVMNMKSIGPNMVLSPFADPGDGELDVILVPEAHKAKFAEFISHKLNNGEDTYQFHTLKAKKLSVSWDGKRVHADDKLLKLPKATKVEIRIRERAIHFLNAGNGATNG